MQDIHEMLGAKIKQRYIEFYDLIDLKIYLIRVGNDDNEGRLEYIRKVVLDHGEEFSKRGDVGVAIVYRQISEKGFSDGANVHIFGKGEDEADSDKPLIHPFYFKNLECLVKNPVNITSFLKKENFILEKEIDLYMEDRDDFLKKFACELESTQSVS